MAKRLLLPALILGMVLFLVESGAPSGGPTSVLAAPTAENYQLTPIVDSSTVLNKLTDFALIPGKPSEAVVTTQNDEKLWRVSLTGAHAPILYGDLTTLVGSGGFEEGLLSVTFSPDFKNDKRIYVYYTRGGATPTESVLSRFDATILGLTLSSEKVILEIDQPQSNHNGGRILFGPDGFLYLTLGDGGTAHGANGQDNTTLKGSILRINVTGVACDPGPCYTSPTDNPFFGPGGGADEIWAYGLRNSWRFSFDRSNGDLWLGDVGSFFFEEVNEILKGKNYGWNCYEGPDPRVTPLPPSCPVEPDDDLEPPYTYYANTGGLSITGGYVYRGLAMPELTGWYIYADFANGKIWAVDTTAAPSPVLLVETSLNISSFAEMADGEILILQHTTGAATPIHRLHAIDSCNWETPTEVGGPGTDTMTGGPGKDVFNGLGGNDVISGGGGNDVLCGGAGSDIVDGGAGDDALDGGLGSDFINGGTGTDSAIHNDPRTVGIVSALDGGDDSGSSEDQDPITGKRDTIGTDVENLFGTKFADDLTGNSSANALYGAAGNDILDGAGGNDFVLEDLFGIDGGGDDILKGGAGNDNLKGGVGEDDLRGEAGNDTLDGGWEADIISGGSGSDSVIHLGRTLPIISAIDDTNDSGSLEDGPVGDRDTIKTDVENLFGTEMGDELTGSSGNNAIVPGGGDDLVFGGDGDDGIYEDFFGKDDGGDDTLNGGNGNDFINGGKDTDECNGDAGFDVTINCESGSP